MLDSLAQAQSILMVDDDLAILRLLKDKPDCAGFEVFTATSGQHALDVIDRRGLPHLAIIDIMMPCMDGLILPNHPAIHRPAGPDGGAEHTDVASRVTLELTNRADLGSDWTLAKCLLVQSG